LQRKSHKTGLPSKPAIFFGSSTGWFWEVSLYINHLLFKNKKNKYCLYQHLHLNWCRYILDVQYWKWLVLFLGSRKAVSYTTRIYSNQERGIPDKIRTTGSLPVPPLNADHRHQGVYQRVPIEEFSCCRFCRYQFFIKNSYSLDSVVNIWKKFISTIQNFSDTFWTSYIRNGCLSFL
jgi:hypothetical protein